MKLKEIHWTIESYHLVTAETFTFGYKISYEKGKTSTCMKEIYCTIEYQPLPLSGQIQQMTNWYFLLNFSQKQDLTLLTCGQFVWNVKSHFLGKIREIFQNFVCWKFYAEC